MGLVLAGLVAMAPQVYAAADNTNRLFQTLDMNGDNHIDRDEFNIQAMEVFYNTDKNKDGFLSRDEMLLSDVAFKALDRERKGKVSGLTFIDSELMDFDRIDSNNDGRITFDEFDALVTSVQKPG